MASTQIDESVPSAPAAPGHVSLWMGLAIVLGPFIVLIALRPVLPEWAIVWPEQMALPFVDGINAIVGVLEDYEILGLFTFKDFTRQIASSVERPLDLVQGILVSGFRSDGLVSLIWLIVVGAVAVIAYFIRGWPAAFLAIAIVGFVIWPQDLMEDWVKSTMRSVRLPALPWIMIVGLAAVLGWWIKGWRYALLAGGCIFYVALFGKWKLSMITLSVVLVAAPIAGLIGLFLGIAAVKWRSFERILVPFLNVMQSLPHFSYLIPVAVFIGVSHKAGAIATLLFAMPPMARLTILGLRRVPDEVIEAGVMAGCTPQQMLWKVRVPAARDMLMVGVNQVIMLCLAMVVIASFVGAKGLGQDLLFRLQSLRIGQALEIGVAIVFIAVMLDRLSFALTEKQPEHQPEGPFWIVHPYLTAAGVVTVVSIVLALITPVAQTLPKSWTITTAPFWEWVVDFITLHLFEPLKILRDSLLLYVLIPLRTAFQAVPWVAVVALVAVIGWRLAGWRLALLVSSFIAFIALTGFWERAAITAYMVFFALLVCVAFGLPLGIWASRTLPRTKFVTFLCDFFQTFPSFIYLIPVIMLFQVGDVAAITAIVIYAAIPTIRYAIIGLRGVPNETIEAAITSGCTPSQVLWKVRFPLAIPEIMLGVNQTIMFALFMVIIAAFIGTKDLGQEIFRALTFNDAGKGLVVGLCVAFIGLTADRLITEWSEQRKRALGLAEPA